MEVKNPSFNHLNSATFVGIDAHRQEHTALAINRFEEEKGRLTFENTPQGIDQFISWLVKIEPEKDNLVIGLEGGSSTKRALVLSLLEQCPYLYEVNPLYTKQRRDYGTKGDKSDLVDAKLIAEVLTRKLSQLPKITKADLSPQLVCLKKTVWFYEETTRQGARIKNQLKQLSKERELAQEKQEIKTLDFIIQEKKNQLGRIKRLQARLKLNLDQLLAANQATNLTTIKGVSTILAAKIVAHTGGIQRFSRINKFIKYAGIAPLEKSSGKTKRYTKSKKGNRQLNTAFYLLALNQLRWNPKAQSYFQKKLKEGKTKKQALRCLMKRVACITYGLLKSGESYRG